VDTVGQHDQVASVAGSIQTACAGEAEVAAEPSGKNGDIVFENDELNVPPSARPMRPSDPGSHISFTVSRLEEAVAFERAPVQQHPHDAARSALVENIPAWPATPPRRRAR